MSAGDRQRLVENLSRITPLRRCAYLNMILLGPLLQSLRMQCGSPGGKPSARTPCSESEEERHPSQRRHATSSRRSGGRDESLLGTIAAFRRISGLISGLRFAGRPNPRRPVLRHRGHEKEGPPDKRLKRSLCDAGRINAHSRRRRAAVPIVVLAAGRRITVLTSLS
ncbi:unnamed protein product [Symbiodinium sp. CCMP2456]|nr:unnamed protein product [Symbiodinium sp. CCMP2456]